MSIYSIATEYRQKLLDYNSEAEQRLIAAYAVAEKDIQQRATDLIQTVLDGEVSTRSAMTRLDAYDRLLEAFDRNIAQLSHNGAASISQAQYHALHLATEQTRLQLSHLLPGFKQGIVHTVPESAIKSMVGFAGDGTPLSKLLDAYGEQAAKNIKESLIKGIAAGLNPKETARVIRDQWGQSLNRATALSRTETLRAFREGARQDYLANSNLVLGYRWLCAKNARTCGACLASDGMFFELRTEPQNHVNCRCTLIPVTKDTYENVGYQTGSQWFEGQTDTIKKKILGDRGYEQYKSGTPLTDFIDLIEDPDWGNQRVYKVP